MQVIKLKGGFDSLDKPPPSFEQLLKQTGVVFTNEPLKIISPQPQSISSHFSWENLIEKLISEQ